MTKLETKLAAIQCGCDSLAGKTIKQAIRERGFYWLLFTDGTWCCTDYGLIVWDLIEWSCANYDNSESPFVQLGLYTEDDLTGHITERDAKYKKREAISRRRLYDTLRLEFEGKQ